MGENEERYREYLQNTAGLVVAFFERVEDFPQALETVRRELETQKVLPDKGCILYRTRCEEEASPRWRVWSQPVPFQALTFPDHPKPPWLGLDRQLNRPMTDHECQTFFAEVRYQVFEIRVSKRPH
jgi:hypothetical protein